MLGPSICCCCACWFVSYVDQEKREFKDRKEIALKTKMEVPLGCIVSNRDL